MPMVSPVLRHRVGGGCCGSSWRVRPPVRLRSHRWGPSLGVGGPVGCGGWWALGQAAVLRAAVGGRRSGRRRSFGPRLVAGARVPLSCRPGCPHRWHPRCAAPADRCLSVCGGFAFSVGGVRYYGVSRFLGPGGGIGRRRGLKPLSPFGTWEFESPPGHRNTGLSEFLPCVRPPRQVRIVAV